MMQLEYPFSWQGIDDFSYPKDDAGVPLVYISRRFGFRYNPITISQLGLDAITRYARTGDEAALHTAMIQAQWLLRHVQPWHNESLAWVYDFDLDFYGPRAPWISAMAQSEAVSLLLRLHPFLEDDRCLDIPIKALRPFKYPVNRGGVQAQFPDGSPVFEEYPTHPPSMVLNGFMFSLIGLHEYATLFSDAEFTELFQQAIQGLRNNLHRYDTGYWNYYDLHPTRRLTSPAYIQVHVQLLSILSHLTGDPFFSAVANRWRSYLKSPRSRLLWISQKVVEKIRLYGRNRLFISLFNGSCVCGL